MNAKKCDRCEKFYDKYLLNEETYHSTMLIFAEDFTDADGRPGYFETRQFELCPSCMKAAVKFMQEKLPIIKE